MEKYVQHAPSVVATYAWCLIPNHFHFLVRVRPEKDLRALLLAKDAIWEPREQIDRRRLSNGVGQRLGNWLNAYAKAFNRLYGRRGRLFEESLRRKKVTNEDYLYKVVTYIHNNAVHHRIVSRPQYLAA